MSTRPQSPDLLANLMLRLPGLRRTKAVKDTLIEKLDHLQDQVNNMTKVDTTCLEAIIDLTESVNALTNLIDAVHQESQTVDSQILNLTHEVVKIRREMTILRREDTFGRFPAKQNSLSNLRKSGLDVKTILDIGVQHGTPQLQEVFPDLKHFLFEPVEEYYGFIHKSYKDYDYELVRAAISETDGENLLNITKMGSDTVTHSSLEGSVGGNVTESRIIKTMTLDTFLSNRDCPKPYLLKLDVDGHELPILRGAEETLKNTSCIVIESPLCYLSERVTHLESKGFHLWDIVDLCYYRNNLHQVDLIFLNNEEKLKSPFSPWQNFEFDWSQWKELSQLI